MIHEAEITFHSLKQFDFHHKKDSTTYKINQHYSLPFMLDRNHLTFLIGPENPLCKIKRDDIRFVFKEEKEGKGEEKGEEGKEQPKGKGESKGKEREEQKGENQSKGKETFEVWGKRDDKGTEKLATILASIGAVQHLKQSMEKNKKYKSSLAFVPSKVKHISILSGQSPTQRFRGFINLACIMFLILNLRNIIQNFIRYGIQFGSTPSQFLPLHFLISTCLFSIFPISMHLTHTLQFKKSLSPKLHRWLCIINFTLILLFNVFYCLLFKPYPLLGITHTTLAMILLLKEISYYQVNQEIFSICQRLSTDGSKSQKEIQVQMFSEFQISEDNLQYIMGFKNRYQDMINIKSLAYFLFLPTLCYQLTYPKTSQIRIPWVLKRTVQLILITGLIAILWFQYFQPQLIQLLNLVHRSDSTWYQLFNRHLRISIPNTIIWIAGFYAFFHLWLNLLGQLLYFGDRNFYRDWWNCRSLEEYWKTWNLPVHFWFIRHMYNPLLQLGYSKILANLLVFFVSAVAHEYLVSVPLGFVSFWAFLSMMMQAPVIVIQKKLDRLLHIENSELSNVSFWISFCIVGQPFVVFVYYSMYTDFVNCTQNPKISGFIPLQIPISIANITMSGMKLEL